MPGPLTLAVMVKNDAQHLERCLASTGPYVDQILVLDTGSTDDTIEVARSHGARVEEIEWPNNFSQALNVLLGLVESEWTLRLDSDEWFDPGEAAKLKKLIQVGTASGITLIRKDLTNSGIVDETELMRLWRTHPLIRYAGVVHETLERADFDEAWPGKALISSPVFFWHDGYLGQAIEEKSDRNLELLQAYASEHPEKLEVQAMLATTLFGRQKPGGFEALESVVDEFLASDLGSAPPPQLAQALVYYLEALPKERTSEPRTAEILAKAVRTYPNNPVILFYVAIAERIRGDLESALGHLLQMETVVRSGRIDRTMSIPAPFLGEKLWRALGFIATKLGRTEIVRRCQAEMAKLQ